MPVETPSLFAKVIQEHLELKQKNARLDAEMPIDQYKVEDPFDNHPLFKTEEQARLEETMDGVEAPVAEEAAVLAWPIHTESDAQPEDAGDPEDSLWGRSRDFDWGD